MNPLGPTTAQERMEAYDALPQEVRNMVAAADFAWDCAFLAARLGKMNASVLLRNAEALQERIRRVRYG